jgi:hypothetical protein
MMCYNRLVREFMIDLIGEKYRQQDFSLPERTSIYFLKLREQTTMLPLGVSNDSKTETGADQCLIKRKCSTVSRDTTLNPVFISAELEMWYP